SADHMDLRSFCSLYSVQNHGRSDGNVVVDDLHGGLRRVDAAVRAVVDVLFAAKFCAPGGVVDAVGQVEAHPIFDEHAVIRPCQPGVGGVGLHLVVAGGGVVAAHRLLPGADHV